MRRFYYVGIPNNSGMSFVTSVNKAEKYCNWHTSEKPLAMSKVDAEDIVTGFLCNGRTAVVVQSFLKLDKHFVIDDGE